MDFDLRNMYLAPEVINPTKIKNVHVKLQKFHVFLACAMCWVTIHTSVETLEVLIPDAGLAVAGVYW